MERLNGKIDARGMLARARRRGEGRSLDLEAVRAAYRRYSAVYDLVFGRSLDVGRKAAVRAINRSGAVRILEVGVGTGLTLPNYRADTRVVGIDLCPEMLERARRRKEAHGLGQVEALLEMDGQNMTFEDASFDAVLALHVLPSAPDPARLVHEMRRVCKDDGEILILNHFVSEGSFWRGIERAAARFAALLGFRPNLDRTSLAGLADLELVETVRTGPPGFATLLRFRKRRR